MASFTDSADPPREWRVVLDALVIEDIREAGDQGFLKGDPEQTITRIDGDPVLLCGVIYAICRKQCEERNVSRQGFYLSVIGDAIDSASEALLKAILSFIPRRSRELLEATAATNEKVRQMGLARAIKEIGDPQLTEKAMELIDAKISEAMDAIDTEIRTTRSKNATASAASSAFTQPA